MNTNFAYSAFFTLFLLPIFTFSQINHPSLIMTTEYGSDQEEMQDLLTFENIDYYRVRLRGEALKGKQYGLLVKEVWEGSITKTDTLFFTAQMQGMEALSGNTLEFKVLAKKENGQLRLLFKFPHFGIQKAFEATDSEDYSLRDIGTKLDLTLSDSFPAFAYILPYEKDGWKMWCAVDSSGKEVESWGKEFGIRHYLIFDMFFN